jgi:hypothetical protein
MPWRSWTGAGGLLKDATKGHLEQITGRCKVPLKGQRRRGPRKADGVKTVIVVRHTGGDVAWPDGRDVLSRKGGDRARSK